MYVSPQLEVSSNSSDVKNIKIEPKPDPDEPQNTYQMISNHQEYTLKKTETDYFVVVSQIILNSSETLFKVQYLVDII